MTEPEWLERLATCSQARYGEGVEPRNTDVVTAVAWIRAAMDRIRGLAPPMCERRCQQCVSTEKLLRGEVPE